MDINQDKHTVYGLVDDEIRIHYIGVTKQSLERRLKQHTCQGSLRVKQLIGSSKYKISIVALEECDSRQQGLIREGWWYDRFCEIGCELVQSPPEEATFYQSPKYLINPLIWDKHRLAL